MKRVTFIPMLVLALTVAACGNDEPADVDMMNGDGASAIHDSSEHMENMGAMQGAPPGGREGAVHTEDGVQVVEIEAHGSGFSPEQITLEAGVPARLIFTRTAEASCIEHVSIPAFDVAKRALPMNEPTSIAFTPTESGTFEFVCGMDMLRGTIIVRS